MDIRTAETADIESLVDFNQKMALETEGKQIDHIVLQRGVRAVFNDDGKGFYVVTEEEDVILGGLMVTFEWSDWRDKWFWWIQSVYIVPEARGRGIYRQMYEFVKDKAKENGKVCGFRLYVEKDNLSAQGVYERVGMEASHYIMFEEND